MVQADIEPTQGLHVVLTGESHGEPAGRDQRGPNAQLRRLGRAALVLRAPHRHPRRLLRGLKLAGNPNAQIYILPQLHFYL